MLIYNFQKEFLGIDEKDLNTLGYPDLASLRAEIIDFADLFVKTPGYIHNFQHVHWIDFIACAESNEESKVIISANSKIYKAIITITNAFLIDNPSQKAYFIHLNNLRELLTNEYENIIGEIVSKPTPKLTQQNLKTITPAEPIIQKKAYSETLLIPDEYDTLLEEKPSPTDIEDINQMLDVDDLSLETDEFTFQESTHESTPEKTEEISEPQNTYIFDPHIASKELGLPIDLIEEFIQDFIDQANDFKDKLYSALNNGDVNNVKILSHKLKGVAANLRVEDAYEVLSVINAASDTNVIKTNLDAFYKIIAKLSGDEHNNSHVTDEISIQEPSDEKLEITLQEPEDLQEPELFLEFKEEAEQKSDTEYSHTKIANEIGIDTESFKEVFKDFIDEAHIILAEINKALNNNDYKTSKIEALKLKGMSDNMRVYDLTKELQLFINSSDKETMLESSNNINKIITKISKVED